MKANSALEIEVKEYLVNLGYAQSQVHFGFRSGNDSAANADMVALDNGVPYLVVEVTTHAHIADTKDPTRLRFNPVVRKLQTQAEALDAPYFLLTDGQNFLWFTTDAFGRPQLLTEAVLPSSANNSTNPSKQEITQSLRHLRDFLSSETPVAYIDHLAGLAIFAKLTAERNSTDLQHRHRLSLQDVLKPVIYSATFGDEQSTIQRLLHDTSLTKAVDILRVTRLSESTPQNLLAAIDEIFLNTRLRTKEPRLARYLCDFLVRLTQAGRGDVVVDMFSSYGDMQAAAALNEGPISQAKFYSICPKDESTVWAHVQQLAVGHDVNTIFYGNALDNDVQLPALAYSHVATVPPLGGRVSSMQPLDSYLYERGIHQTEDLYLEQAIRWVRANGRIVMMVPESMLFAAGKRNLTRRLLQAETRICAIISLAAGALRPYSSIKTSILVLDKTSSSQSNEVLMAHVDDIPSQSTFDSRDVPPLAEVLTLIEQTRVLSDRRVVSARRVPHSQIDANNLTATRYLSISVQNPEDSESPFPKVPLAKVTEYVKRGSPVKLREDGTLNVIGPGAIRPFILEPDNLGRTTDNDISKVPVIAQIGDVVLNNIGDYLGAAAMVEESAAGSYVNQHVMLLRVDQSCVLPEYVAAALNSDFVKLQIQQRATGTILPALTLSRLSEITIPLPDLATQHEIVSKLRDSRDSVIQARAALAAAEAHFSTAVQRLSI